MFKKSLQKTILLHFAARFAMLILTIAAVLFFTQSKTLGTAILIFGFLLLILEVIVQFFVLKKHVVNPLNSFIVDTTMIIKEGFQSQHRDDVHLFEEAENEWVILAQNVVEIGKNINQKNEENQSYQRHLESEISRQNTQLEKVNHELQALIETEYRTAIEKSHFLAMLAHELKSPLATIEFATENLQRSTNPDIIQLSFKHIRKATQDMAIITQRCLEVDKLEQPNSTIINTTFSLNTLIYELIKGLEGAARLQIHITLSVSITSDELLYQIIVSNLIENALKYSPENSIVEISVKKSNAPLGLLISVTNEVGKAGKPDATKVFEKYYRHTNAQRLRGTGLGLWLVRGITTQLGGNVNYIEHNNKVKFQVWLPHQ